MANKFAVKGVQLVLAATCILSFSKIVNAEELTPAKPDIACLQTPAKLDDAELQSFMNNPKTLLSENLSGGLPLSNRVRELAGSSSHAFDKIMELTKEANDGQKAAIAAGLARTVYACDSVGNDVASDYGAQIQTVVAGLGDATLTAAFQKASNDVAVAAVGPGTAGFSIGGASTDGTDGQQSGDNSYKSPGDGPLDTSSAEYSIGTNSADLSP
jgi:hypothetical protein